MDKKLKREKLSCQDVKRDSLEKLSLEEIFLGPKYDPKSKKESVRYQELQKKGLNKTTVKKENQVSKLVSEYILLVNKMGEAPAKSSNMDQNKFGKIEWFTGMYFLYKRFIYERKKIQKWLENGDPMLARDRSQIEEGPWQ